MPHHSAVLEAFAALGSSDGRPRPMCMDVPVVILMLLNNCKIVNTNKVCEIYDTASSVFQKRVREYLSEDTWQVDGV